MVRRRGRSSEENLADRLIAEALEAVEKIEGSKKADSSSGSLSTFEEKEVNKISLDVPSEKSPSSEEAQIKIDLKSYVEREAYLRLLAEFENFRKRAQKDREASELSGRERVFHGFLEILDNFERGLQQSLDDGGPLAVGMRMILSQAEHWLKTEGLERIQSVGERFDPTVHEAVGYVENSEVPAGHICQEIRRGYRWKSRLLRAAGVLVSRGLNAAPKSSEIKKDGE